MEAVCDENMQTFERTLQDQHAVTVRELTQKFNTIQEKKVSELEITLNDKCDGEKSGLEGILQTQFEAWKNEITAN